MSKRFSLLCRVATCFCAILALLSLSAPPARAADMTVRIGEVHDAVPGDYARVSISLENQTSSYGIGGFDLLIGFNADDLTLTEVHPGALLDSCGWEYFQYHSGALSNCDACPSGMVRIVAVAETNNGAAHPSCFFDGRSGELASMEFYITADTAYDCLGMPISFYWNQCSDNTMASVSGDSLYFNRRVYESSNEFDITGQPGYGGWQGILDSSDCMLMVSNADTVVDFYDSQIEVRCIDSIDQRGDINLNGIAYEIADLVMFCNYFLYGLNAFPPMNVAASIAASDINADGMPLTYRDAVFLCRIVYGDVPPFPKSTSADTLPAVFNQNEDMHQIAVAFPGELAGAYLLMKGDVIPTFMISPGFSASYHFDGTNTHILILGDLDHRYGTGIWFTYEGSGVLESVETTDWFDHRINVRITHIDMDCGDFDGSGSINISDVVYIIRYIFSGGFAPVDIHGGDVNCDGLCNISDVVYVLDYIFSGGPAPCEHCK